MKKLIVLCITFIVSGCISTDFTELQDKVHINYQEDTYPKTAVYSDEDLSELGIVLLRAKFKSYSESHNPLVLSLTFSTQEIQTAYSGRILIGNNDYATADRFFYESKENKFFALALKPGVYRYISSALQFGRPASRFSPTRDISFTVKAGEAVYVGDLTLSYHEKDLEEYNNIFHGKLIRLKRSAIDFNFNVSSDFSAAKQFYESISRKPEWPLKHSNMHNSNNPFSHYYSDPNCNGFYNMYASSRGFCK